MKYPFFTIFAKNIHKPILLEIYAIMFFFFINLKSRKVFRKECKEVILMKGQTLNNFTKK